MIEIPQQLRQQLVEHHQEHLLMFWDELSDAEQSDFLEQLHSIDYELIANLINQLTEQNNSDLSPSPTIALEDCFLEKGEAVIRAGELAVLTVAGGQGTRLGWSGPKGTFPATPITGKSLFQLIAEQIVFASKKYKVTIPWYIMTSRENDAVTRAFLLDNNCFGLTRTDIFMFAQGEVPAVDDAGKMLLASKNKVAMNPDGHGGAIAALKQSGGLDEMEGRGVKHLSYVQIDNPLANVIDPIFIGLHTSSESSSSEATSKCVEKTNPTERVGVFCNVAGKTTVVEYCDLPKEKTEETDEQGNLTYNAGSIAIHLFSTEFLQRIADDLPWHKANKKVHHISLANGEEVTPKSPNACKFEQFVFDVLPLAAKSLVVQTLRQNEFAPIKNATGDDSPSTSQMLQQQRASDWLSIRGVDVPESAVVEISPLTAASPDDLEVSKLPDNINQDEIVAL